MIINQRPNILYKEPNIRKKKAFATKEHFSNNNFVETPLKREADDISFRGVSFKGLESLSKSFALYNNKEYRLKDSLAFLKKYIGKAPVVLEENTSSWEEIKKYITKTADGSEVKIKEKNWTKQLFDAAISPITDIPFRIVASLKKSFFSKSNAAKKSAQHSGNIIKNQMDTLDNADIVNSLIGYMDSASKYKYDTDKIRSAGLMSNALKMFDPKSGNYNAVHERALTRIVTGFIPAFFLANDAYNLSRICDDDPQKADKERKLRFNQETKRVLSNAYLQLITLGALSKWINKSKATFIGVTALTVVITEAFSRISNGKKIHMINKEEAIEMNKKEGTLPADYQPEKETNTDKKNNSNPAFKSSQVFQGFGIASDMPLAQMSDSNSTKKSVISSDSKPLLSPGTIAKWFVGTIVLAFALKHGKNIKLKNSAKIGDYLKVISEKYNSVFNSFTRRDYTLAKDEYRRIINKLKEYDTTVGEYFEQVINRYQKTKKVESLSGEFAQVLNEAGLNELGQKFKHIANTKLNKKFKDIPTYKAAQAFLKNRKKDIITKNLNDLFKLMEDNNLSNEARQIKEVIFDKNGIVDTSKYNKAKKLVKEIAKDYEFTFENRFKVDDAAENLSMFKKAIEILRNKNPQEAEKYNNLVENSVNADLINLGKRDIPGVKELADFVTEPFKFIWGTVTLPYKHFARYVANWIKPEVKLPEYIKEQELVAKTIDRITKKPLIKLPKVFGEHKGIAKIDYAKNDFADYMNKQFNKGFNTTTMSSISNSDLSALAKNTSTAATIWFLMTDNHNMVMQKSNGENKQQAVTKAKERLVQETSRTFYNVMFINLFNNTFRSLYNSSLFGAQTVNTASTLVGEYVNRTLIGMPVARQSRDEILEKEYKNITDPGIKGKFFRFMSRLTGKKVLSQRTPNEAQQKQNNK